MDNNSICNWCCKYTRHSKYSLPCPTCKVTMYCDNECMIADISGHSQICHEDTGQRKLKYANVLLSRGYTKPNISVRTRLFAPKSTPYPISYDLWVFGRDVTACGLCGCTKDIIFDYVSDGKLGYYACELCTKSGYKLCPNTGYITKICKMTLRSWVKKMVLLSAHAEISGIDDILVNIVHAIASILPCDGNGCV